MQFFVTIFVMSKYSKELPNLERDERLMNLLSNVIDPELQIPIVDMGLIYEAKLKDKTAFIKMTLTTVGCPLFHVIENDIENTLLNSKDLDIKKVDIDLIFDPPWHTGMMSEEQQIEFGI